MTKGLRGLAATAAAVLACLVAARCETADDPFPDTSGLFVILRDATLGTQGSASATRQITLWRADRLDVSVPDREDYAFLPSGPCSIFATAARDGDPAASCGGSALTLEATGQARDVTFRLDLTGMETISARRPSLPSGQDYDGDGVANGVDNCPIVSNADQAVFGDPAAGKPGVVCAADDGNGDPTLPDQDGDGVRDALDNCLWVENPILQGDTSQTDLNRNGIGDLCEVVSGIPFANAGRLSLECPGTFTLATSTPAVFVVDFTAALTCDDAFGVCALDTEKITARLSSDDVSVAKTCVDVSDEPAR